MMGAVARPCYDIESGGALLAEPTHGVLGIGSDEHDASGEIAVYSHYVVKLMVYSHGRT